MQISGLIWAASCPDHYPYDRIGFYLIRMCVILCRRTIGIMCAPGDDHDNDDHRRLEIILVQEISRGFWMGIGFESFTKSHRDFGKVSKIF